MTIFSLQYHQEDTPKLAVPPPQPRCKDEIRGLHSLCKALPPVLGTKEVLRE